MALFLALCIVTGGILWLSLQPHQSPQLHRSKASTFPVSTLLLVGGELKRVIVYFPSADVQPLLIACGGDTRAAHRLLSHAINAQPGKGRRWYLQQALERAATGEQP